MSTPKRMTLSLSSPERIRERSCGEVHEPETVNKRTHVPEEGGLFCEVIFGPVSDFECRCGKYNKPRYAGIQCEKCGVLVTWSSVRRERMGHIELAAPVVHPWYFKQQANKLGYLLGMRLSDLKKVIYYERRVVIQPGSASALGVQTGQLLSEDHYHRLLSQIRSDDVRPGTDGPNRFSALTGGEAILQMLQRLDLDARALELRYQVKTETSQGRRATALRHLDALESFREAARRKAHRPEWMVLRALPVIPPDLRPLVVKDDGKLIESDLNRLYRRVIIRNNRVRGFTEIRAPRITLREEKRMLQEAVDDLLDKGTEIKNVRLKSMADMVSGKEGRLRQNLLGKRVNYSGRSVIVAGPELELHQCGLPRAMAAELYRPFIIRRFEEFIIDELIDRGVVEKDLPFEEKKIKAERIMRSAERMAGARNAVSMWGRRADAVEAILADISEKDVRDYGIPESVSTAIEQEAQRRPVLLNRAPTLHRLGMQAFQPVLTEEKAIQLHPLVCAAYNADFDGDQMAVHVPLSDAACREARRLMRPIYNILSPAHGKPLTTPSQDMLLGLYSMTKAREDAKGAGMRFASAQEVRVAYDHGTVALQAQVKLRAPDGSGEMIDTTVGRVLFNEIVPEGIGFANEVLGEENMRRIIARVFDESEYHRTARFLDDMKALGFEHATRAGHTFSLSDLPTLSGKQGLIEAAAREVEQANARHDSDGLSANGGSEQERHAKIEDIWQQATKEVTGALENALRKDRGGFNSIHMMAESGARGSAEQIRQLGGMRGLMSKPVGRSRGNGEADVKAPILSNFKEGLSALEYFISTHGGRRTVADTSLKTADAGHLTRRLVDVAQDVSVTEEDCGTRRGTEVRAVPDESSLDGEPLMSLKGRIVGRAPTNDVKDPRTGALLAKAHELISEKAADAIAEASMDTVEIRSPLTCEARRGVCACCYGHDLAMRGQVAVETGEAVGVVAAQSIGEPGTQLTLRTFHTGGAAREGGDITSGLPRAEELFEARTPARPTVIDEEGTLHLRDPRLIYAIEGPRAAEQYIISEILKVYRSYGVAFDSKHAEVIVRQMMRHMEITDPGDTELHMEKWASRRRLTELNSALEGKRVVTDPGDAGRIVGLEITAGSIMSQSGLDTLNTELRRRDLWPIQARASRLGEGRAVLLGITKAALLADSWVAAASFENTTSVLIDAVIRAKEGSLYGMKSEVIASRLTGPSRDPHTEVPFMSVSVLILGQAPNKAVVVVRSAALRSARLEPAPEKRTHEA